MWCGKYTSASNRQPHTSAHVVLPSHPVENPNMGLSTLLWQAPKERSTILSFNGFSKQIRIRYVSAVRQTIATPVEHTKPRAFYEPRTKRSKTVGQFRKPPLWPKRVGRKRRPNQCEPGVHPSPERIVDREKGRDELKRCNQRSQRSDIHSHVLVRFPP